MAKRLKYFILTSLILFTMTVAPNLVAQASLATNTINCNELLHQHQFKSQEITNLLVHRFGMTSDDDIAHGHHIFDIIGQLHHTHYLYDDHNVTYELDQYNNLAALTKKSHSSIYNPYFSIITNANANNNIQIKATKHYLYIKKNTDIHGIERVIKYKLVQVNKINNKKELIFKSDKLHKSRLLKIILLNHKPQYNPMA